VIQSQSEPLLLAHGLLQDPGAVPLVIAVAGHRDPRPEYLQLLRKNLQEQLKQLIDRLPYTPLLMLNGLAEGMDSEAAEVFLQVVDSDRKRRGGLVPHHQLVGVLPKTPGAYRDDFADPNALARLEMLLHNCDGVLHPGNCPDLEVESDADEAACYGKQGVFLVRHCYLLFGFFDGVETNLVGGTSQTLAMQKGEIHPLFVSVDEVLANKEPGALVVHHTPRLKPGSPLDKPGSIRFWCGAADAKAVVVSKVIQLPETLLTIPNQLESINRQLTKPGFEGTSYNAVEGRFTKLWSLADHRAFASKCRYELWCKVLVITGFGLVLLAQLSPLAQGLWWALLLLAFVLFPKLQQGPKLEFIAQRCLAECLTVQHLWIAMDVDGDAADLFHSRSNADLGWIRTILRAVRVQLLSFHTSEPRIFANAAYKAQIWIDDQVHFLTKRVHQFLGIAAFWRNLAVLLASSAIVLATIQSLPGSHSELAPWVVVLLAGFASVLAYSNLMGYADTADRYQRSLKQFERGQRGLALLDRNEDNDPELAHQRQRIVVEAIGREKLDELNDWVAGQLQRVYAPGA
jgi:hypothetical protein